ncbi:MAG: molybdopterin oxidoreductase family protein, partial [Pirellulales bacterium]
HLALKPKSDLELLYGIAHILITEGWINEQFIQQHVSDYDKFAEHVESFTPEYVERVSGISKESLHYAARTIHKGKRVSFWWTMGVNQSYQGVRTAQAIINLALISGNIGRPGTGANSITGQCNAMGSRLFSNTTNLLGGHDFKNLEHRQKIANTLRIDENLIPKDDSWAYDRIIEGILRDEIKGLWVVCTNPAHSWINQNTFHEILDRLDFLVVQDMYHSTETARRANLYLPAAGWGEKEGTFINSERRIGLLKKVAKAPGQALSDFSIFRLVSHYWGCEELFENWQEPEDVFQTLKELSRDQPCDITGIKDYQMLDQKRGIQWPYPEGCNVNEAERRLFADGQFYHLDGKARLLFENSRDIPEPPNERYPYLLLTGRGTASQWHTQTRTAKSRVLRGLYPQDIYVEINPQDAHREGINPNAMIQVESQRGSVTAKAFVTPTIQQGQLFIPMHYGATNQLTLAHFDPYSRQPSYKNCAVCIALSQHTPFG